MGAYLILLYNAENGNKPVACPCDWYAWTILWEVRC